MYNFDIKTDRINERCRKWDKKIIKEHFKYVSDDFIPLWIADMDFKAPDNILNSFKKAIDRGVFGYTYVYDEFYDAVINWKKDMHGVEIYKEWITLSYGTVSTLHYIVQAFCNENDFVIMNTPVYEPFNSAAIKQGVRCIYNKLNIIENRYYIDFEEIESQLREFKPKLYLLCSPHNPSGRIWSIDELRKIAMLCKKYKTILVVDEVHGEQIHFGRFYSILSLEEELMDNIILLSSPNKAFNLGGLKTSYSIIPNKNIRERFRERLFKNSITSPNVFGIIGIISAYNDCKDYLKEVTKYIYDNYLYTVDFIDNKIPKLSYMKMESSYLLWINISKTGITSTEFTKLLSSEYGVLVEDGNNFVCDGEGWIRINLGTQRENIKKAMERIEKCVQNLDKIFS
ncbi:putative C-S lyase [Caloramator sp. E03]|uniref:MalY/PatB family protein n=1 Tax=Caloramator sp. E03 TaxID=2576307 RepID=UPI001110E99E|nr:PatB family C-S lyase [Caloramator sp. E03]QCX32897.1 putative C-S lyase [Caloramator sp. E03]